MSAMRDIYIDKVVVHMGVGESGERLVKAEDLVKKITGQKPVRTIAKRTQPAFGIRKGAPIGCKVTLRRGNAEKFVA
ncbi:MAG: 50S ribosomal protein L5, partial [Methanoculleus sp.]|nr:50S ribosomal protein L5 [Methanoculleus sp.]